MTPLKHATKTSIATVQWPSPRTGSNRGPVDWWAQEDVGPQGLEEIDCVPTAMRPRGQSSRSGYQKVSQVHSSAPGWKFVPWRVGSKRRLLWGTTMQYYFFLCLYRILVHYQSSDILPISLILIYAPHQNPWLHHCFTLAEKDTEKTLTQKIRSDQLVERNITKVDEGLWVPMILEFWDTDPLCKTYNCTIKFVQTFFMWRLP